MLALNANIEASRSTSGEEDGGFGVVAQEVKELSQDAKDAAEEIEDRLEAIREQTRRSADEVEQTSEDVDEASAQVADAVDALEEIAEYAGETNTGVQEISAATQQQAASTQEVVAMVDEAATISEETTAESDGDEYVIDGGKLWISNGSVADTVVIFAKTDPEAGAQGISSFILRPEEDDGFIVEGTEDKLGDKGCPTAELRFDSLRVPESRRLGEEGEGLIQALKTLNGGRITIAARSVGVAQAALDEALAYAQDREQFDQPISDFQAIQHKLADMDTKISAARMLMHRAADLKMNGDSYRKEAAQAKLYASEVSREVANEGIQIHGGYGYVKDFPAERFYRDAKLNEIYEGTSEVLRNTIADQLLD